MLSVNGYRDGSSIILDRNIDLPVGEQVLVTIVDKTVRHNKVDLSRYMGRGKSLMDKDAQEAVRELRDNDRM